MYKKSKGSQTDPTGPPKLVVVCGLSFAGKSTLSRALSKRFGFLQVDVDETKGSLHDPEIKDGELTQEQWNAIYEQTDKQIETRLKSSQSVVDASRYFKKAERNKARLLARNLKADFVTIYIDTPESVARQRWLQNRRTQTRRDIPDADFQEIVAVLEPPTADESPMLFHFADDIERWISIHSDFLGIRIQNLNISSE